MADSARKVTMDRLRALCEEVRGGVYFVKRGPIDWSSHNYDENQRAISILLDDHSFLKDINDASISLEFGGQMLRPDERPDMDDGLLDEMIDDAEWIIRSLIGSTNSQGDNIILQAKIKDARIVEFHDAQLRVQGIVAFFEVNF